jgi:hypothetical protein
LGPASCANRNQLVRLGVNSDSGRILGTAAESFVRL